MAYALTWLADVLRAAGCVVVERPDWQTRGRAEMGTVRGVLCHHTAGPASGNAPSLALVEHGRVDLPGPLSHLVLGRDGTFYVLAAGRCNHAGAGEWEGITAGNTSFIGIEAENMGTAADPWPAEQVLAYARGVAAILRHIGAPAIMCAGHKEYALPKGRKIDPSFDMDAFREQVAAFLADNDAPLPVVSHVDPVHAMLRRGDKGASVRELQTKLVAARWPVDVDGDFGPGTERQLIAFQRAHGLVGDGKAGPKTWAALNAGGK